MIFACLPIFLIFLSSLCNVVTLSVLSEFWENRSPTGEQGCTGEKVRCGTWATLKEAAPPDTHLHILLVSYLHGRSSIVNLRLFQFSHCWVGPTDCWATWPWPRNYRNYEVVRKKTLYASDYYSWLSGLNSFKPVIWIWSCWPLQVTRVSLMWFLLRGPQGFGEIGSLEGWSLRGSEVTQYESVEF